MTRSRKLVEVKDEDMVALKEQVSLKDTTNKKKNEVRDERSQWREKPIIIGMEEIKDNERELEAGKQKEKEEKEKVEKIKKKQNREDRRKEKRNSVQGNVHGTLRLSFHLHSVCLKYHRPALFIGT